MDKISDLVIIGSGPAGLAASIYASRYGVEHLILGKILGGQISETHQIDNYPGMPEMSGFEFSQKWGQHVDKYGVKIKTELVKGINKSGDIFNLSLENGEVIQAKTILLATGTRKRMLNIPGEVEFLGKGVSYCATCDGFFYKGKTVGVVGGSDSAVGAAVYLGNICEKVYIIYRREDLRCEPYWKKLVENNPQIEVVYGTNLREIKGSTKIERVLLDMPHDEHEELALDGLFIEVGSDPDICYAQNLGIKTNEMGCVEVASDCSTNVPGVWAAGDITDGSDGFRQVITAASEGAIAARSIFNYLKRQA